MRNGSLNRLASGLGVCLLGILTGTHGTAAERPLPRGHEGEVTAVAFSTDGKKVVSGGTDHTVRVWDAENLKEVKTLQGAKSPIAEVMFSRDGKQVAAQDAQNQSWRLWDLETGKQTGPLPGSQRGASFTPDSRRFVSSTFRGDRVTRQRWEVPAGTPMPPPPEFKVPLPMNAPQGKTTVLPEGFAYSPDGKTTAEVGETRVQGPMLYEAFPWLAVRNREECRILAHRAMPRLETARVLYSPDGKKLLVSTPAAGGDVTRVYDAPTLNEQGQLPVGTLGVASDSKHIVGRGGDGTLGLYDLNTGKKVAPLPGKVVAASPASWSFVVNRDGGLALTDLGGQKGE